MASSTTATSAASGQQTNVWQTAGRRTSRTPQNRSGTASPNPQSASNLSAPAAAPRQDSGRPAQQQLRGVWASRSGSAGGSNGPARSDAAAPQLSLLNESSAPVNGFNRNEVEKFLSRDAGVKVYRSEDDGKGMRGKHKSRSADNLAEGQAFLGNLAKQIAKLEQGG